MEVCLKDDSEESVYGALLETATFESYRNQVSAGNSLRRNAELGPLVERLSKGHPTWFILDITHLDDENLLCVVTADTLYLLKIPTDR